MEFSKNGNISFGGVYVVNGSKEDVKKATDNLKKVAQYGYEKEIPLKTYTTNFKNSSSAIVATEDDSFTLSSAMKEPDFKQNVKDTFKASGSKKNFISNIVKNIFNNGGDVQNVDAKEIFFDYALNSSPKGPNISNSRYIIEDVPQGLVLLESLGQLLNIKTPICTSLI